MPLDLLEVKAKAVYAAIASGSKKDIKAATEAFVTEVKNQQVPLDLLEVEAKAVYDAIASEAKDKIETATGAFEAEAKNQQMALNLLGTEAQAVYGAIASEAKDKIETATGAFEAEAKNQQMALDSLDPKDIEIPLKTNPSIQEIQDDINSIKGRSIELDFEQVVNPKVENIGDWTQEQVDRIAGRDSLQSNPVTVRRRRDRVHCRQPEGLQQHH